MNQRQGIRASKFSKTYSFLMSVFLMFSFLTMTAPAIEAKSFAPTPKCAALATAQLQGGSFFIEEHRAGKMVKEIEAHSIVELSLRLGQYTDDLAGTDVAIAIAGDEIAGGQLLDFVGCLVREGSQVSEAIVEALVAERPYLMTIDDKLIEIDVQANMMNFDHIEAQTQAMIDAMLEWALQGGGSWTKDRGQGGYDIGCGVARVLYDEPCLCAGTNKIYLGSGGCKWSNPSSNRNNNNSNNNNNNNNSNNNGSNNNNNNSDGPSDPEEPQESDQETSEDPLTDPDSMPGEEQCLYEGDEPESLWYWSEVFRFDACPVMPGADYNNFNMRVFTRFLHLYTAAIS